MERIRMISKGHKMIHLQGFKSFNAFVGLAEPLAREIDAGTYEPSKLLYHQQPLVTDFYRISVSAVCTESSASGQIHEVALSSPNAPIRWDDASVFEGLYLQISQELMNDHCYNFNKAVPERLVQRLYLSSSESEEIKILSDSLIKHLKTRGGSDSVSLSYVHVLLSLIDSVYQRQVGQSKKVNFKRLFGDLKLTLLRINKGILSRLRTGNIQRVKS